MTCDACRSLWTATPNNKKAEALDAAHPQCACEPCSLRINAGLAVDSDELVARVITVRIVPSDESIEDALTRTLFSVYTFGLSLIRTGATDDEIRETVRALTTGGREQKKLVGAAILKALEIRALGSPERWFCVYDTDAPLTDKHADVLGTTPSGSRNAADKARSNRRYTLRDELVKKIVLASDADDLIAQMRTAGM